MYLINKIILLSLTLICIMSINSFSQDDDDLIQPFAIMSEYSLCVLVNSAAPALFYEPGEKSIRLLPAYTFSEGYGIYHIGAGYTHCII